VLLPTFDPFGSGPPPVVAGARLAEDLGFDAAWVDDHLIAYPPVLDAFCCLSAVAAVRSPSTWASADPYSPAPWPALAVAPP
jgi:alkanesulfonate monooxygenase SsuD/methylene tetrahydromethanopterin reductase-like flavin-dependent oxidoreductase (luciferase family)